MDTYNHRYLPSVIRQSLCDGFAGDQPDQRGDVEVRSLWGQDWAESTLLASTVVWLMLVGVSGVCPVVVGTGATAADGEAMEEEVVMVVEEVEEEEEEEEKEEGEEEEEEDGLRSIRQRRQDDCSVQLQFDVEVEILAIPGCALQTAEGLAGFGNPADHFIVDLGVVGEGVAQIGEIVRSLQLGAVHVYLECDVGNVGWRLMHDHCFLRVDHQAEVVTGGGEEVHAPLHVPFGGGVESTVVGEQKSMDGSCGYTRLEVHPPSTEKVAVRPIDDPGPGALVGPSLRWREHESEEGGRQDSSLLHSASHCECL
nr:unnamed protein product [Spirometra erinaceieuropaei]